MATLGCIMPFVLLLVFACSKPLPSGPPPAVEQLMYAANADDIALITAYAMGHFAKTPYTGPEKAFVFGLSPGTLSVWETSNGDEMDYSVRTSVNPGGWVEIALDNDLDGLIDEASNRWFDTESGEYTEEARDVDARRQDSFNSLVTSYAADLRSRMR